MTNAEVGISKAIYNANEVLASLLLKVKNNLSQEEIEYWDEYVDAYLTGKSGMDEVELKDVLDDICNRAKTTLDSQGWTEEIAKAIYDKVLETQSATEVDRISYNLAQRAEDDFIAGKSDSLLVEQPSVDLSVYTDGLHGVIFNSLVNGVARYAVLVSKSHLLQGKLEVDATEFVGQNIGISREIGKEVLQNFSAIVNSAYQAGANHLHERINQNAVN